MFLQFRVGVCFLFHVPLFIQSLFDNRFHLEYLLVCRRFFREYDPGEIPVHPCIGMGRVVPCLCGQKEHMSRLQYLPVRGKEANTVYHDTVHRVTENPFDRPVSAYVVEPLEEFIQLVLITAVFLYLFTYFRCQSSSGKFGNCTFLTRHCIQCINNITVAVADVTVRIVAETAEIFRGGLHLITVCQLHLWESVHLQVRIFSEQVPARIDRRPLSEDAFRPVNMDGTEVEMGIEVMIRHKLQEFLHICLPFRRMGEE